MRNVIICPRSALARPPVSRMARPQRDTHSHPARRRGGPDGELHAARPARKLPVPIHLNVGENGRRQAAWNPRHFDHAPAFLSAGTHDRTRHRRSWSAAEIPSRRQNRATSLCVTLHKGTLMHAMRARRSAGGRTELERPAQLPAPRVILMSLRKY